MKLFVLYDKAGIHSGRVLGKYLINNLRGKATTYRGRPKRLEKLIKEGHKFDYVVNIGWYREFNPGGGVILNQPSGISHSSNKRRARRTFAEKGIPAPKLWTSAASIRDKDCPVIGRTTHHAKGQGLWYCESAVQVRRAANQGATHFMRFIPNTREFRVHVMAPRADIGGLKPEDFLAIKLSEKLQRGNKVKSHIVKNHDNGWFFGYPSNRKEKILKEVRAVARNAIHAFGLHWGAVDIMVSRDTGQPLVLEINSSPCLTDDSANTLEKYARGISVLTGLEKRPAKRKRTVPETPRSTYKRPNRRREKLNSFLKRNRLL